MSRRRYWPVAAAAGGLLLGATLAGCAGTTGSTGSGGPGTSAATSRGTADPTPTSTVQGVSTSVPATGPTVTGPTVTGPTVTGPTVTGAGGSTPGASDPPAAVSGAAEDTLVVAGMIRPGATGPQVLALQRRLTNLGYWMGTPDGHYGGLTQQAVTAVQKVAGLERDGVVGPLTAAALQRGVRPTARSRSGHVIEVDKARQVLLVVDAGQVSRVLNASTGSGAYYTAPDGHRGHAVTPVGRYGVIRGVDGWDTSPLGHLYRPRYFNGGIAVHGYPSVPPGPASHGCVRVSLAAMDLIWQQNLMPRGGTVLVY